MPRRVPPDDAARRKKRRAADTRRWRDRQRRKVQLFEIEADGEAYDWCIAFAGLKESQISNKVAVSASLGRLLRMGIAALLEQNNRRR
jgi:hypothetical protein